MKQIKDKKWFLSTFTYLIFLAVSITSFAIMAWYIYFKQFSLETLYSMKSYYSAESWIEEWLLLYKKNPNTEEFVWEDKIIDVEKGVDIEYKDQNIYKWEIVIEELIEAWKSIQIFINKAELAPEITKIHIATWKRDEWVIPTSEASCQTPKFNSATEIWAFQRANIITSEPLNYLVDLNSNWNWCYSANNPLWKKSIIYYTDPYSNEKFSYIWDKCIINNKWNVSDSVFEQDIPYSFEIWGDWNWQCQLNCTWWNCSHYYTTDPAISVPINWYQKFYTIAPNINYGDFTDDTLIAFDIRAIDDDSHIIIWATDDNWKVYQLPWRFINITATGVSSDWLVKEWLFTRLTVKKKSNIDLLPIFDWALYSESEFIK